MQASAILWQYMKIFHDSTSEQLRDYERGVYERLEQEHPEKLKRLEPATPADIYPRIGITIPPQGDKGFLRFYLQDFIVEEVAYDGSIATIEPQPSPAVSDTGPTVYVDVVKGGLGTYEAISHLATTLGIEPHAIGYGGMKDGRAITSQRMSIRGVPWEQIRDTKISQVFLNFKEIGKGAIAPGQVKGNRFTIVVRTEQDIATETIQKKLETIATDGFPNFYGVQRFGNRLLNPILGKNIVSGNLQEALKIFLTATGPFDIPLYHEVRTQAATHFGDWQAMKTVFDTLPYSFRHERAILASLIENPNQLRKALMTVADQVKFWVYGYTSFLVNHLLSRVMQGELEIPEKIPLPLSGQWSDEVYHEYLQKHGTASYAKNLQPFPFFIQKQRTISAWIIPEVHGFKVVKPGVILSFSLPKAVYATTFLMSLFELYEGTPLPSWIRSDALDSKAELGTGSVNEAVAALNIPEKLLQGYIESSENIE